MLEEMGEFECLSAVSSSLLACWGVEGTVEPDNGSEPIDALLTGAGAGASAATQALRIGSSPYQITHAIPSRIVSNQIRLVLLSMLYHF